MFKYKNSTSDLNRTAHFWSLFVAGLHRGSIAILIILPLLASAALAQPQTLDCSREPLPPDENPRFFPVGTFGPGAGGVEMAALRSCHLRAMRELPLEKYLGQDQAQAYRLMVWPAYRLPLVVRLIIKTDGTGELAAKAEKSEWEPGVLSVDRVEKVSKPEADRFLQLLEQANFWLLPTDEFDFENQRLAAKAAATGRQKAMIKEMDGVDWDLEGATGAGYHLVSCKFPEPGPFTPPDTSSYAHLASYIFRSLGKLEVPPLPAMPVKR